jgi:hypothetical protein
VLNETARLVWEALQAGAAPEAVGEVLAERFGIPVVRARRDVLVLLARWDDVEATFPAPPIPLPSRDFAAPPPSVRRIYALCGVPIALEFTDRKVERAVHALLGPSEAADAVPVHAIRVWAAGAGGYRIALDGGRPEARHGVEESVGLVVSHLIELSHPDLHLLALFHAGAVALGSRAVLMPGPSGTGKSTLTAGLVHAGARYFSDDVVPMAASGRIVPVPVGLCLKRGSWTLMDEALPPPATVGGQSAARHRYLDPATIGTVGPREGLPIAAIVFPRYRPGAPLEVEELDPLAALEGIVAARAWLSLHPPDLALVLEVLRTRRAVALTYGTLQDALSFINEELFD